MHNVLIIFYIAFSIGNLFILPELVTGFVFFCKFVYLNKRPDEKVDHVLPPPSFL